MKQCRGCFQLFQHAFSLCSGQKSAWKWQKNARRFSSKVFIIKYTDDRVVASSGFSFFSEILAPHARYEKPAFQQKKNREQLDLYLYFFLLLASFLSHLLGRQKYKSKRHYSTLIFCLSQRARVFQETLEIQEAYVLCLFYRILAQISMGAVLFSWLVLRAYLAPIAFCIIDRHKGCKISPFVPLQPSHIIPSLYQANLPGYAFLLSILFLGKK